MSKKLFKNIDHVLKHAIKVTATNLKAQDKWDMLLIADNSEVAHRVLSALEILDDSIKAPIEDETFNKQADPFMRTRSRAKTLTHQLSTQGTNGYAPVRAGSITEAKVQKGKGAYTAERKRIEKSKTDFDFIMSIIQHSPLFRNTTEEVLEDLTQIMRKITITDGMVIANQGTYASNFYIIQEGKVQLSRHGLVIGTLGVNSFVGERALQPGRIKRDRSALALVNCQLGMLKGDRSNELWHSK